MQVPGPHAYCLSLSPQGQQRARAIRPKPSAPRGAQKERDPRYPRFLRVGGAPPRSSPLPALLTPLRRPKSRGREKGGRPVGGPGPAAAASQRPPTPLGLGTPLGREGAPRLPPPSGTCSGASPPLRVRRRRSVPYGPLARRNPRRAARSRPPPQRWTLDCARSVAARPGRTGLGRRGASGKCGRRRPRRKCKTGSASAGPAGFTAGPFPAAPLASPSRPCMSDLPRPPCLPGGRGALFLCVLRLGGTSSWWAARLFEARTMARWGASPLCRGGGWKGGPRGHTVPDPGLACSVRFRDRAIHAAHRRNSSLVKMRQ